MTVDVKEIWEAAMVELVIEFPIYAQLLTRIGTTFVNEPSRKFVAWTDGRTIYVNESMIKLFNEDPIVKGDSGTQYNRAITKREMMFLLCHELLHLIGLTYDRGSQKGLYRGAVNANDRHQWELWNKATDYEINSLLHNNEKTTDRGDVVHNAVGKMPDWVLYESDYRDKTAEEIFEILKKEDEKNNRGGSGGGFGGGSGKNQSADGGQSCGNNVDGLDFSIDDHMPIQDDATRNEVLTKMSEVFGSRTNGLGMSSIDRMINNVYKPQPFNWRRALTRYIRGWMKDNYTWNRPSRAGIANNLILPSSGRTPKMHIGVAVDTSGSIHDTELHTMMDHLFTILSQFKDFTVDVWCCGSKVYPETFRTYTASNKRELHNFKFASDGGNDMRENFKFIQKKYKQDKLDVFICMSDFYDPLDGDTETVSPCPCIWMVLDHPTFTPPSLIKAETYPFVVEESKNNAGY